MDNNLEIYIIQYDNIIPFEKKWEKVSFFKKINCRQIRFYWSKNL